MERRDSLDHRDCESDSALSRSLWEISKGMAAMGSDQAEPGAALGCIMDPLPVSEEAPGKWEKEAGVDKIFFSEDTQSLRTLSILCPDYSKLTHPKIHKNSRDSLS